MKSASDAPVEIETNVAIKTLSNTNNSEKHQEQDVTSLRKKKKNNDNDDGPLNGNNGNKSTPQFKMELVLQETFFLHWQC